MHCVAAVDCVDCAYNLQEHVHCDRQLLVHCCVPLIFQILVQRASFTVLLPVTQLRLTPMLVPEALQDPRVFKQRLGQVRVQLLLGPDLTKPPLLDPLNVRQLNQVHLISGLSINSFYCLQLIGFIIKRLSGGLVERPRQQVHTR